MSLFYYVSDLCVVFPGKILSCYEINLVCYSMKIVLPDAIYRESG